MRLSKLQATSDELNRVQDALIPAVNDLIALPLSGARIIEGVSLTTGTNIVNHGLNRVLRGWIPVRVRSAAWFYDVQDANRTPTKNLLLVSSADVVADILVF